MWICWFSEQQCLGKHKNQLWIDAQYQKRNQQFSWALYLYSMENVLWFGQAACLWNGPMLCLNLLWGTWRFSRNVSPVPFTSVWKSQTALLCVAAIRALPCRVISPQALRRGKQKNNSAWRWITSTSTRGSNSKNAVTKTIQGFPITVTCSLDLSVLTENDCITQKWMPSCHHKTAKNSSII